MHPSPWMAATKADKKEAYGVAPYASFLGKRKPRDSRVVQKRFTGEQKILRCGTMKKTCQSKSKNTSEDFIYEEGLHRQ